MHVDASVSFPSAAGNAVAEVTGNADSRAFIREYRHALARLMLKSQAQQGVQLVSGDWDGFLSTEARIRDLARAMEHLPDL